MKSLTASDRKNLIRLAASLPKGDGTRRAILSVLQGVRVASASERDLDKSKPIVISGLKGMKSKPATKKFKNFAAYEKWLDKEDSDAGDWTIQYIYNE